MATHHHTELATGPMLVVNMQSRPDLLNGRHVHGCPECYEHVPCKMLCSVECDLTLDDGTPCGAYVMCATCVYASEQQRKEREHR